MPTNGAITPPSAKDQHVAAQQRRRADRPVADSAQGQRDQQRDDQGVEDDRRDDRRLRRAQIHHVELLERTRGVTAGRRGIGRGEDRRQDREVLGDVVGDRERRQRSPGDQQLLADLNDLDQLRWVRVEVDHVPGLARSLGAGVHRHADVGLRQRRSVVGPVAGHRHEPALGLVLADQLELALRGRLGEEVVDSRLAGDLRGGQRDCRRSPSRCGFPSPATARTGAPSPP